MKTNIVITVLAGVLLLLGWFVQSNGLLNISNSELNQSSLIRTSSFSAGSGWALSFRDSSVFHYADTLDQVKTTVSVTPQKPYRLKVWVDGLMVLSTMSGRMRPTNYPIEVWTPVMIPHNQVGGYTFTAQLWDATVPEPDGFIQQASVHIDHP